MKDLNIQNAAENRCVLVFDERDRLVFANKGCEAIFKCSADNLYKRSLKNIFVGINQKEVLERIQKQKKGNLEIECRLNSNLVRGYLTSFRNFDQRQWLLFDLWVAPAEKTKEERSSEPGGFDCRVESLKNYLDDLLEASFDGIVISDENANLIKANKAYENLTGITKEEIIGHNLKELIENGVIKKAAVFEVTKTRIPTTMLHVYPRTGRSAMVTGNPVFDKYGKLIYVVANVRDVTQLAKMRKKLGYFDVTDTEDERLYLSSELADEPDYGILVKNKKMQECLQLGLRIARFDTGVLLMGESGVGKTMLANIIHRASSRKGKPFVIVNCGSIPQDLLESELFGYQKGAFTGANDKGKMGQFEMASGGTLVLDEIGELSLNLQVKLLRAIEEKKINKVGDTKTTDVDIRIIAVTNRDLKAMVENNKFRKDLYYRLSIVPIVIPPLRERRDEIPLLIKYFFDKLNRKYGTDKYADNGLIKALDLYDYPGNVRELKNLIERLIVVSNGDLVTLEDFGDQSMEFEKDCLTSQINENFTVQEFLEECEKQMIMKVLDLEHTLSQTAKRLGISNVTLWRKLKKYGIRKKAGTMN